MSISEAKRTLRQAVNSIDPGELSGLKKAIANLCIDVTLKPVSGGFKYDPIKFDTLAKSHKFQAERASTDFARTRFRKIFEKPQLKDIFTLCARTERKDGTLTLNISAFLPHASSAVQKLFPKVKGEQRLPSSEIAAGSPQAPQRSHANNDAKNKSKPHRVRAAVKPRILLHFRP